MTLPTIAEVRNDLAEVETAMRAYDYRVKGAHEGHAQIWGAIRALSAAVEHLVAVVEWEAGREYRARMDIELADALAEVDA